jgi:hypothetical protein
VGLNVITLTLYPNFTASLPPPAPTDLCKGPGRPPSVHKIAVHDGTITSSAKPCLVMPHKGHLPSRVSLACLGLKSLGCRTFSVKTGKVLLTGFWWSPCLTGQGSPRAAEVLAVLWGLFSARAKLYSSQNRGWWAAQRTKQAG